MTQARALFAAAVALVALVFAAIVIQARHQDRVAEHEGDTLAEYGEEQARLAEERQARECTTAVTNSATIARADLGPDMPDRTFTQLIDASRARCIDDDWTHDVTECLGRANTPGDTRRCMDRATQEQRDRLGADTLHLLSRRPSLPMRVDMPGCDDYRRQIAKLTGCTGLPKTTRDALQQAYDQARVAWAGVTDPATRRALDQACTSGADAIRQAIATSCP